jgi:hypothetical protein
MLTQLQSLPSVTAARCANELKHQLIVVKRKMRGRVEFTNSDRLFFSAVSLVSIDPQGCDDHSPGTRAGALASCGLPPLLALDIS